VSEQEPDPEDGGTQSFADPGIEGGASVFAASPEESDEIPTSVGNRPRRRAGWAVALGLGYVVLAAGTAFGVIADKSPKAVDVTAVDASAYAAPLSSVSASAGSSASKSTSTAKASASASPSAAASTTTVAPTPKSTVTGSVSNGIHSGDLRYFLLPPPQGPSSVQGNPDGNTETIDDVVSAYSDKSTARSSLEQIGFKTACIRTYQDTTMGANVTIEMLQFDSSSGSSEWLSSFGFSGDGYQSISVSGESGAVGWSYAKNGNYELVGAYREGDTFFEVTIYGAELIPAPDLGQVISAEHARLAKG
jgi:hypothetical protein